MIVAWHEVPGKRPPKEPSRRVRYDRALLIPEVFLGESAFRTAVRCDGTFPETSSFQYCNQQIECAHLQESDRTLPDGSFEAAISRHFVPGYDRTVPP
jgi:hypothetical protein